MDTWHDALGGEKQQPYFQEILNAVRQERLSGQIIYPPEADVFNAFRLTAFDRVKVVITKREADRQSKSFDTDRASSVSSVGISRFFWLPPFFTGKQLFESTRYRTDKLEAMNAVFKRQSLRVRFIWRNSNSS